MKKKLQKLTSLTLASAITLASCSPNGTNLLNADEVQEETKKAIDASELLEKCVIQLTPEDQALMEYCVGLIEELMTDSEKAKAFIASPNDFIAQHGSFDGELDEGMIEMMKVLAHEDIKQAIEQQDFKQFTALCKKYDVISIPKTMRDTLEVLSDSKTMRKIAANYGGMMGNNTVIMQQNPQSIFLVACAVFLVGVVAVAVAEVALAVDFVSSGDPEPKEPKEPEPTLFRSYRAFRLKAMDNQITPSALTLYKLNANESINTVYASDWVEEQYQLADNFLMQNDANYANNAEYRAGIQQIIKGILLNYTL